jgi:phosphinothricin tripeptide acetyl hydrolase
MMGLRLALIKKFIAFQLSGWDEGTIEEQRANLIKANRFDKVPSDVHLQPVSADGVPCEWISAPGAGQRVMIYLHGGVYALGAIDSCRAFVARLARACNVRGLAVEYSLAPEHPYPEGLNDIVSVYQWLLDQGTDPRQIIIAGDSAGAGLALAAQLALRDAGLPQPAATVCLSPWSDLTLSGATIQSKAAVDPIFDSDTLEKYVAYYAGDHDPAFPLISPQFADFSGFPPLLIQVGTDEVLLDDARRLAENAKKAGVSVKLEIWEGLFHDFQTIALLKESKEAIDHIAKFVSA